MIKGIFYPIFKSCNEYWRCGTVFR